MQIIVNETDHLVIQERSRLNGIVLGVGSLLWINMVMGVSVWGTISLSRQTPLPTLYWMRLIGLGVVFVIGCFFAIVGGLTAVNVIRGMTLAFDRATAQVTITRPRFLRTDHQFHSLYGISHAQLVNQAELNAYALYLVQRDGTRIPLTTVNRFEVEQAESIVHSIRAFLHGR